MSDRPSAKSIKLPSVPMWEPPRYYEHWVRSGEQLNSCDRCGSVVTDVIAHNRHHRGIDQLKEGLVALTAILIPGLPSQTLLSVIGSAESIGMMIEESARPPVPDDISVGRGGGGNNPDIPPCPGCGAFGGGGHGGGCRNTNKPVVEWV